MRRRFAGFAAALACLSVAAWGQPTDRGAELTRRFFGAWMQGAYLEAIELIEQDWQRLPQLEDRYLQHRPALDGFVVSTEERRRPAPAADPAHLARFAGAEAVDAVAEIAWRAAGTRVVIVNEAHDNPRDRAFLLAVGKALRPLGFTHYAAEAFPNALTEAQRAEWLRALAEDGYIRQGINPYVAEPMFGNLIRGVLELGYRPVSYEIALSAEDVRASMALSRDEQIEQREQAEAENLARAIAAAGPDAKFLIHVGYGHASERTATEDYVERMARRLPRLTGIDPLTVDQTVLSEYAEEPAARALHKALVERVGDRPRVFVKGGRPVIWRTLGPVTDLQVVHPPIRSVGGRPDWLRQTGRIASPIPAELLPKAGRRLVQVFAAGEASDAVPLDQVLVTGGAERPVLYVPAGRPLRWAVQGGRPAGTVDAADR